MSHYEDNYGNTRCSKCFSKVEGGYCNCFLEKQCKLCKEKEATVLTIYGDSFCEKCSKNLDEFILKGISKI